MLPEATYGCVQAISSNAACNGAWPHLYRRLRERLTAEVPNGQRSLGSVARRAAEAAGRSAAGADGRSRARPDGRSCDPDSDPEEDPDEPEPISDPDEY